MSDWAQPEEFKKEEIKNIFKEVLADDLCIMVPDSFVVKELGQGAGSEVTCNFLHNGTQKKIKSSGNGMVDALFGGLLKLHSKKYKSLCKICFTAFAVKADMKTKKSISGSDSEAMVVLETSNEKGQKMIFRRFGKSVNFSSVLAVFDAVEFYVNCELVFKKLVLLVEEAKGRNRFDIASSYTSKLVEIIGVMTYEEDN